MNDLNIKMDFDSILIFKKSTVNIDFLHLYNLLHIDLKMCELENNKNDQIILI